MTWKEIKDKIESEGVRDQDNISYIDISSDLGSDLTINCEENHGEWSIVN